MCVCVFRVGGWERRVMFDIHYHKVDKSRSKNYSASKPMNPALTFN